MRWFSFLTAFLCLLSIQLVGQNIDYVTKKTVAPKIKKYFDRGIEDINFGEFKSALRNFRRAIDEEPKFIDAHIYWAAVQDQLGDTPAAVYGFSKALELDPQYDPKVMYTLALIYWRTNDYAEAAKWAKRFLESRSKNETMRAEVRLFYENCVFSIEALKHPVAITPTNLGPNINTAMMEYLPSISIDDSTLVFTRKIPPANEDFYQSRRTNGVWQMATPITEINTPNNEGAQSISADGTTLVYASCAEGGDKCQLDLFISKWVDGKWGKPKNMGSTINTPGWESYPSISANADRIFFASKRLGGKGEVDIWTSVLQKDGQWAIPENLGDSINTPGVDQAPFIHPDGNSLYFMSNGHPGMGGYDLYISHLGEDGKWKKPINLGYPINTKANEGSLVVSFNGKTAYYTYTDTSVDSKALQQKSFNDIKTDLYTFDMPQHLRPQRVTFIRGKVIDGQSQLPVKATISVYAFGSKKALIQTQADATGAFISVLPAGKTYGLHVSHPEYLFYSDNFEVPIEGNGLDQPIPLLVSMQKIKDSTRVASSKPIVLKNVLFKSGSAALLEDSYEELNRLFQLLNSHPELKIQINGHTDNIGNETTNQTLSTARAKAVADYLQGLKISPSRISYRGFGKSKPIDSNETEQGRRNNRRTEFEISPI